MPHSLSQHPARLDAVVGIDALMALAAAPPAAAALSFTFDRASARPGTAVVASEPGWSSAPAGVTIYLVPTRLPGVKPDPAGGYCAGRPRTRRDQARTAAIHPSTPADDPLPHPQGAPMRLHDRVLVSYLHEGRRLLLKRALGSRLDGRRRHGLADHALKELVANRCPPS
jgi:hypothetical protein